MAKLVTTIQLRRDTQANLNSVVLKQGEPAYATDTKKFVIGDGVHSFLQLLNIAKIDSDPQIKSIEQRFAATLDENISFTTSGNGSNVIRSISAGPHALLLTGSAGFLSYSLSNGEGVHSSAISPTNKTIVSSAYGQSKFVIVSNEDRSVFVSVDTVPMSWYKVHEFEEGKSPEVCRYINNTFFIGGANLFAFSKDGEHWEECSFPGIGSGNSVYDIVATDKDLIAVVGNSSSNTTSLYINHFGDKKNWVAKEVWYTGIDSGTGKETQINAPIARAAYYVNGNFILAAKAGVLLWSNNLEEWHECVKPTAKSVSWFRSFTYGNGKLILTMYGDGVGQVWLSKDSGKTWELNLTDVPFLWSSAFYNDSFFIGGNNRTFGIYKETTEWQTQLSGVASFYYQYVLTDTEGNKIYSNIYKSDSFSEVLGDYYTKSETDGLLDGKLNTDATAADSSKLNNQEPSYYLDYNNFTNTPTIPTKTSDLTNDSGFLTDADMSNFVTLDGEQTIDGEKTFTNGLYIADYKIALNDFGYFSISDQDANTQLEIHEQDIAFFKNVVAGDYDSYDLGSYDLPWKDLYLSGKITDGENEITINQLLNLKKEITFKEAGFDLQASHDGQILPWIIASTNYSNTNYPYVIKEKFIYDSSDDYPILTSVIDEIFRSSISFDSRIWEFEVHVMNSYDISWTVRNLQDGNSYFYSSYWYSESDPGRFKRLNRRDADANIPFPRLEIRARYDGVDVHCESKKAIAACNDCGNLKLYIYFKNQSGHWTSKPFSGFYQDGNPDSSLPQQQTFSVTLNETYYSFYLDYFKLYTNFNAGPETMPWPEIRTVGAIYQGSVLINKQKIIDLEDLYSYHGHAHNWLDFKFGLVVHRDDLRFEGPTSETYRLKLKESVKNFSPHAEITFEEAFEIVAI